MSVFSFQFFLFFSIFSFLSQHRWSFLIYTLDRHPLIYSEKHNWTNKSVVNLNCYNIRKNHLFSLLLQSPYFNSSESFSKMTFSKILKIETFLEILKNDFLNYIQHLNEWMKFEEWNLQRFEFFISPFYWILNIY